MNAVEQNLNTGRFTAPYNSTPALKDSISAGAACVSTIMPRVNTFEAITENPSSILFDNQNSAYLTNSLVVDSTSSILNKTASMAATVRATTESLFSIDREGISVFSTDTPLTIPASERSVSIDSVSQNSLVTLSDRIQGNVSTFNDLLDTSLATSRLNAEIFARPATDHTSHLANVNESFTLLNTLSANVYNDMSSIQTLDTEGFIFKAPTIEPYAATCAIAVIEGINEETLEELSVESADEFLDNLGDELDSRLQMVDPNLSETYREGIAAIESGHQGWIRHAGVSFRTMFDHLLRHLAPDTNLHSFFDNSENNMIKGEFSRNARLRYIFRDIATGSYTKMAEQDIKISEATFFPSNDIVHSLSSPLSDKQMRVFCRRIQGSVSVVLEAAGY